MIDKLEFRVPNGASGPPFTEQFAKEFALIRNDEAHCPFRSSRFYTIVGDLRPFGHDAVLHLWSKRGKVATHKLELLDTSRHTIGGIIAAAEQIFALDFFKVEISRIDFAVDINSIPVSWFSNAVSVRFKRLHSKIAKEDRELLQMGGSRLETLYYGKRPNIIRIYDKMAELRKQFGKLIRKGSTDQEQIAFEEFAGFKDEGQTITRIERQIGGDIPDEFKNLKRVISKKAVLNPFQNLQFVPHSIAPVDFADLDLKTECTVRELRRMTAEMGLHWTKKYVYSKSHGQGARAWKQFEPYLQESTEVEFNDRKLFDCFQDSLLRQLGKDQERVTA